MGNLARNIALALSLITLFQPLVSNATVLRFNYTLGSVPAGEDAPGEWIATTPRYGDWTNVGDLHACSNWSPSTSSQGKGLTFIQTATDCQQDQERSAQGRKKNKVTGEIVDNGAPYTDRRSIDGTSTRDAIGVLENWIGITPTYTSWIDTNPLYGCTAWSPSPSTFTTTSNFTQTSATCKTDQERQRQEREQEKFTSEIRDIGQPITEQQTKAGQTATRPYSVTLGDWTAVGDIYACTNWSPAVDSIGKGIKFTQNATDCKLNQTRTRAESFNDHLNNQTVQVGSTNENRTLTNQANAQESTGTMEQWAATSPTYTAWVNTSALNACSNWAPNPAGKTSTSTFTQTATNCTTDQTRTRQDREVEQNTGEIRDKGVPVAETQTLTSQSASRSYTVTLAAWADNGAKYACSNWSPAPSTVTIGQSFTQTATDCKQDQKRPRTESYVDHKSGSTVAVSNTVENQTLSNQTLTQSATGTKETWTATTPTYTAWTNTNALYGCSAWAPAPSSKTATATFTQTASDCETDQTRNRQDREQESTTLALRNKGTPAAETQTLTAQTATRNYTVTLGAWTNSGAKYACSNWSPAPSTVTIGQSFTQTATDCKQDQTRTRAESYVDHKTGTTTAVAVAGETKTLTGQTDTQSATGTKETWAATTPTYTAWTNTNALYGCSVWTPAPSSKTATATFTQTASDCETDQTRNRQDREQESTTLAVRNKGTPVVENQTLTAQSATRNYTVTLGTWTNSGAKYACSNWSPAPSTVTVGQAFTQTATDCKQDQARTRAESYVDHKTGSTVAVTVAGETQTLSGQSNTQSATGTKETWAATTPTYTAWTNTNALYGCAAWTPAPSSKAATATFTQTASDCETDQTRNRQDREQESTTLAIRNKGTPVVENQTLTSQTATRSYTVTLGAWTNSGAKYACSNWSPAPSTVTVGQAFTQTATDCKQDQTRSRAESYVDHKTGSTVAVTVAGETQTLTGQSNTQGATGSKETWVSATPTYTAWTNTNALYGCAAWTPAPSSKTATATFAQTASDCETDQTRNRQDREQESTTLAFRNKGTPVVENQTLTTQTATRSYTVTLGAWTNSGAKYACSNWSPAPSTVTVGQAFTQTATDCKQDQTRTRAESYVDHKTGSTVAVTVAGETQTLSGQSNTQGATGTKETWVAITPTYTAWTNTNALYNCVAWTPASSTKTASSTFTQTAADCKTDQTRNRQDREQESTTLTIRNKGTLVAENQTLTAQTATRSYTVTLGSWVNYQTPTLCTNWAPASDTVLMNTTFTQNASDCSQVQNRSRNESYVDHKTGNVVALTQMSETQTLKNVAYSRQTLGTGGLNYYPLPANMNSEIGITDGSAYSNGKAAYLIYGPYVKPFKGGSYTLKIYGQTVNATNTTYDIILDGATNFVIPPTVLPANTTGLLLDRVVNIPAVASTDFGLEIRVRANNPADTVRIVGYTLTPNP
jgi:hypothetical protein